MPIGPPGYHIQIKDKAWQPVVETVLGGLLRSYMVVNKTDEKLAQVLMDQCGCLFQIIQVHVENYLITQAVNLHLNSSRFSEL
ncbi:hypothetical protein Pst134EA_011121 [Puccinia striiformis f. sp. tritici]|uniref:hypothetical protein n=1 Tax=Puccinia striiformis f. sp. tritici TaxID=168172 RepID=UPI002007A811|nr:hypothetical protein Pst134EA_011121 [Puccinia striiformis f. sp. tritici]KAH9467478.1 hypothetical protein Pst134EA_011121 [Puccinia striiformis f. sp. tritici]